MTGDGECDEGCREERGEAKTDAGTYFSGKIDELGGRGGGRAGEFVSLRVGDLVTRANRRVYTGVVTQA